ncbi:DUF2635 domain-containing protein [Vibrio cholerae]|nr:DUF2635 domain-containing protein [Vibrio cholerae]
MEQNQIKVKPDKASVPVRKENGEFLKQEGETVPRSAFWVRRLKDGDVVLVKEGISQGEVAQVAAYVLGLQPTKKPRAKAQETGE